MARTNLIIGIDPGVQTGFALWSREEKQFLELATVTFWSAYDRILLYSKTEVEIVIENPDSKRSMYRRTEEVKFQRGREKMAVNVGSNRREASLLIERLQALGYTVRAVSPVKARKWTVEQFQRYTKYEGRTSQHTRDAARLVAGM